MLTVLHASDLQVGRPYRPEAGRALVALARDLAPDVVVVAGDLTQRARKREYARARELLDRLPPAPLVVTPGNHDVPLYRVWERAVDPFRNWRSAFGPDLDTVTRVEGAVFVALSSAAPHHAVVGGRITAGQVAFAREAFAGTPPQTHRVLVTHHHFVPTPDGKGGRPLPGAAELLRAFESMEVTLVLGGHVHRTLLTTSRALVTGRGPGIPLVRCGTTTSTRGRDPERGGNSLNVIRLSRDTVEVLPHRFDPSSTAFVPTEPRRLPLPDRPASVATDGLPGGGA